MSSPRVYTIEEINGMIPRLSQLVGQQLLEQSEIEQRLAELARLGGGLPGSLEPGDGDQADVLKLKSDLRGRIARYEAGWREVQSLGAVVKDPQIGLLDFYGQVDGKLVWLCWRYGEDSLGYYHDLEAGYSGRRPLKSELRERLLN
jgi:hypothetical protein